jgi:hypothetical protein
MFLSIQFILFYIGLEADDYLKNHLGFTQEKHRKDLIKTFGGNIWDLNSYHLANDDNELTYRKKCRMAIEMAKTILWGFRLKDLKEMRKHVFPTLVEQVTDTNSFYVQ